MTVQDVRTFNDAGGDRITTAIGSCNFILGPGTIAVILRKLEDGRAQTPIWLGTSGTSNRWGIKLTATNQFQLHSGTSGIVTAPTISPVVVEGFFLLVASKANGTVAPRFHAYEFDAATFTHEDGATTLVNSGTPGTSCFLGNRNSTELLHGDMVIGAIWNTVLSDVDVETLVTEPAAWAALSPVALWTLDQASVAIPVQDTIGAADQTAIVGTSVTSIDVPWTGVIEAHSGSSSITGGGAIVCTGQKGASFSSTASGGGAITELGRKGGTSLSLLSGGGDLISIGGKRAFSASTSTGGGSTTSDGFRGSSSISSISGGGSIVCSGFPTEFEGEFGPSSVSGGGSIACSGFKSSSSTSSVSGSGSIVSTPVPKEAFGSSTLTGGGSIASEYVRLPNLDYSRPLWPCPSGDGGTMYAEEGYLPEGVVGPPTVSGIVGGGIRVEGRIVRSRCEFNDFVLEQRIF